MAEYLSEEDMNTGEYISRDLALKQLNSTCLATSCDNYNGVMCRACAYADAMDFIDALPAADVQPVDRWISVKDRLPDEYGWYLVMAHNRVRAYEWSIEGWYNERDLPVDDKVVTYWMTLPEPPKSTE